MFLKDLFMRILPDDRGMFRPLREFLTARRSPMVLGLISWSLIWICLAGLLSFSYYTNSSAIRHLTSNYPQIPSISGEFSQDVPRVKLLRTQLEELMKANRRWVVPRVGFQVSTRLEDDLETRYLGTLTNGLFDPFDVKLKEYIATLSAQSDPVARFSCIEYLVARIQLIENITQGNEWAIP